MSLAIVGSSGGMKGIFVQGVFNAFEQGGLRADAYAGASASTLPAISAAAKLCDFVGIHYWQRVLMLLHQPQNDLSNVMRMVTREWESPDEPFIRELFKPNTPRLFLPANYVKNPEAAAQTQHEGARRLGRQLLVSAARHDRTWVNENLELHLYDTQAEDGGYRVKPDNLADVSYASTRMIHWQVPAWIEGQPYVDASYTCVCPIAEMVDYGYTEVLAISTEIGPLYRDIFTDQLIPDAIDGVPIHVVRPDVDLGTMGVDFTDCTEAGLVAAFEHGQAMGFAFLEGWD
jgi:hypothetical protein